MLLLMMMLIANAYCVRFVGVAGGEMCEDLRIYEDRRLCEDLRIDDHIRISSNTYSGKEIREKRMTCACDCQRRCA